MEESEQEEEEEKKKKPISKKKKKKSSKANMDLLREAGMGYGYMGDYFNGASKIGGKLPAASGFTHLNTIEEEKHETQTSNYFRDAAAVITESERGDYDQIRGSKILDDPDLINTSSKLGGSSPQRMEAAEFDFGKKQMSSAKNSKGKASDILVEHGTPQ